jgi:hypothetical protein
MLCDMLIGVFTSLIAFVFATGILFAIGNFIIFKRCKQSNDEPLINDEIQQWFNDLDKLW